ncbi:hypothetical protein FACS1894111_13280 [Clostridia bacterium]|nr:hypothetical protein FACS1894111_13280 [Clostridia bacterium]
MCGESDPQIICRYIGPTPPKRDHKYTLALYALDCDTLNLREGFYLNELHDAMEGHILSEVSEKLLGQC